MSLFFSMHTIGRLRLVPLIVGLLVLFCAMPLLSQPAVSNGAPASPEMQKAVQEFINQTRDLGLRADSPRRRSGSSGSRWSWHGSVFENFRNNFLDAVPHEIRQRGGDRSTLRRNQFGFSISGPVVIPKLYDGRRSTYFSLTYEGVRQKVTRPFLRTVATILERHGDFSQTVDSAGVLLPIYDPATTVENPAFNPKQPVSESNLQYLRTPFPGNQMPASALDPVVQRALSYYPNPNASAGPFFQNNYFIQGLEPNTASGMIGKVDQTIRARHRVSFGFSFSDGLQGSAPWYPTAANPARADVESTARFANLEHIFTKSANTVNTVRFEAETDMTASGGPAKTNYVKALGLSGPMTGRFPVFEYGVSASYGGWEPDSNGYLGLGRPSPEARDARNGFTFANILSVRRGKHTVRLVGRIRRDQSNSLSPRYPTGIFRFVAGPTSLPGVVNTGHQFATFLLGLVDNAQLTFVDSRSYFRRTTGRLSFGETYQMAKGLTLGVSVDYEALTPRVERYDRQSTVDLSVINPVTGTKGAMIVAGRGRSRSFQPYRDWFDPTVTLAWTPGSAAKTTIRASFSRLHEIPRMRPGQWGAQAFNGEPSFTAQNSQIEPAFRLSAGVPPLPRTYPNLRLDAVNDQVAQVVEVSGKIAVFRNIGLTIEHELAPSTMLTVVLENRRGRDIFTPENGGGNPNAVPLSALKYRDQLNDVSFFRMLRPYPQYLDFDMSSSWPKGRFWRDSVFVRLEKRASQGLVISADYEFSKQMDDYGGPGVQDVYNTKTEKALAAFNNPHRVNLRLAYELPFGAKKKFLTFSGWRRHLVDGMSIGLISNYESGRPLALQPMFNNTGGVVPGLRVNSVPSVDPLVANPGPALWFNPAAFIQPDDFTTGNMSRRHPSLRSPIFQNHDLSFTKRFAISDQRSLEFIGTGLNFLNHANWNMPDLQIGSASSPNLNAGTILGSTGGRVIQLGLRFNF